MFEQKMSHGLAFVCEPKKKKGMHQKVRVLK